MFVQKLGNTTIDQKRSPGAFIATSAVKTRSYSVFKDLSSSVLNALPPPIETLNHSEAVQPVCQWPVS